MKKSGMVYGKKWSCMKINAADGTIVEVKRETSAECDVRDEGEPDSMPSPLLLLQQEYPQDPDEVDSETESIGQDTAKLEPAETCSGDADNVIEEHGSFVYLPAPDTPEAPDTVEQNAPDPLKFVYGEGAVFIKGLRELEPAVSLQDTNTEVQDMKSQESAASAEPHTRLLAPSTSEPVPVKPTASSSGSGVSPSMADEMDKDTGAAVKDNHKEGSASTHGSRTESQQVCADSTGNQGRQTTLFVSVLGKNPRKMTQNKDIHGSKGVPRMIKCKDCDVLLQYGLLFRHMFEEHQHCFMVPEGHPVFRSRKMWAVTLSPSAPSFRKCQFCHTTFDGPRLLKHMLSVHYFLLRCPFVTDCGHTFPSLTSLCNHLMNVHDTSSEMASKFAEILEGSKDNGQQPEALATSSSEDHTNTDDSSAQGNRMASGHKSEAAANTHKRYVDKNLRAGKTPKAKNITPQGADHCSKEEGMEGMGRLTRAMKRRRQLEAEAEQKSVKKRRAHEAQDPTASNRTPGADKHKADSKVKSRRNTKNGTEADLCSTAEETEGTKRLSKSKKQDRKLAAERKKHKQSEESRSESHPGTDKVPWSLYQVKTFELPTGRSKSTEALALSMCPKCNLFVMSTESLRQHLFTSHNHLILNKQCSQSQSREVAVPFNFPETSSSPMCTDCTQILATGPRFLYHMVKTHGYYFVCPYSICRVSSGNTFHSGELHHFLEHLKVVHGYGKSTCKPTHQGIKSEEWLKLFDSQDATKKKKPTNTKQSSEPERHSFKNQIKAGSHTDSGRGNNTTGSINIQVGESNDTLCPHCHMVLESDKEFIKHMSFSHIYLFLCHRDQRAEGPSSKTLVAVAMSPKSQTFHKKCLLCSLVLANASHLVVHLTQKHDYDIMCPYNDDVYSSSATSFVEHFYQAHRVDANAVFV